MSAALIYRPNNRKLIWTSFICAIAIHLTAVVLAENKSKPVTAISWGEPDGPPIEVEDPSSLPEVETVLPPDQLIVEDQEFFDEDASRRPIRPRKKTPVAPVPGARGSGMARTMGLTSAKALTLYAPKPNYPYEARRGGVTGSGIAQLTVNSAAGNVIDARMSQSTGSTILDNATLSAFRRWKFKPGVATNIDVPVTYTLTGVTY